MRVRVRVREIFRGDTVIWQQLMRCYTRPGQRKCHKTAFGDGALTADQKWKWGWLRCGVWPFARTRRSAYGLGGFVGGVIFWQGMAGRLYVHPLALSLSSASWANGQVAPNREGATATRSRFNSQTARSTQEGVSR